MTLSEELSWRGFINQTTYADITELDKEPITFYWGVDPSADSMTIGHLAPAMMIRHFINHGHKAILLAGGATGLIGDPDGKKQERELKTPEEIQRNVDGVAAQYKRIFDGQPFDLVNNIDWFKGIGYLDFLREVGKHMSMTQLLDREFIKSRIGEGGEGISYAEFSYALIQGYDFLHLYREKGATLQVAGADQWGNSIAGVSLIRKLENAEAHVFTTPLIINKQTGVKFGKSEAGAVWLDPVKTSPYKFYQFWLNCDDETSQELIKIYTLLDRETIESILIRHQHDPGKRELQRTLAHEVTTLVHGETACGSVEKVTNTLFGGVPFSDLSVEDVDLLSEEIPTVDERTLIGSLVSAGVAKSNSEARRLIEGNAVALNGEKMSSDCDISAPALVQKGKNSFILVK